MRNPRIVTSATGEHLGLPTPLRRIALATLVASIIMAVLDGTIVNVALPTIVRDLRMTPAESIWIVNGFQIANTATIFAFASLGDLFGQARIWRAGLAIFIVGSLLCAFSHSLPELASARILQGLGAASILGNQASLLRSIYPARLLGRGIGWFGLTVAISSVAGPSLGGLILGVAPWPWLFLINIPFGLAALIVAARTLPYQAPSGSLRQFDLAGAALSGIALSTFLTGIEAIGHGMLWKTTALSFLVAIVSLSLFIQRERTAAHPLLSLDLFSRPMLPLSTLTSMCSFTAQGIALITLPYYFQTALGKSPLEAGLLFTAWPLAFGLVAPISGRLADRYPVRILATSGLIGLALGCALLAMLPSHPSTADVVWRELVAGFGFGFFQAPNNRAIITSVPRERSGAAGGLLATARNFGQTLGPAIVAIGFGYFGGQIAVEASTQSDIVGQATPILLWVAAGCAALGAAISALRVQK